MFKNTKYRQIKRNKQKPWNTIKKLVLHIRIQKNPFATPEIRNETN